MNYYQHHIGDFNNATRHLTRVERSVYREAIELYYDREKPLSLDIARLEKRLLCGNDEEKEALKDILEEYFIETDEGFFHSRCDAEIEKFQANITSKAKAGRASAEARKKKALSKLTKTNTCSTPVQQSVNEIQLTKNQEPITTNQEPSTNNHLPPNPQWGWDDVYPQGCFRKSKTEQKQIKVLKNNEKMIYIGKWFGRSESTLWNVKEAKILQNLNPSREEVLLMGKYYTHDKANKPLRKSLEVLLNNWSSEIDRANTHIKEKPTTNQTYTELNAKAKSDQLAKNLQNPLF